MKTIKEKNRIQIFGFIMINYIIVTLYYKVIPIDINNYIGWSKILGSIVLINLFISIVNGLIPRDLKETIVFWKIKNRLPGYYCFTKHALHDGRISIKDLEKKLGKLPTPPKKQNELWYKIYKEFENEPPIVEIHRLYVLSRDLASIVILIFLIYITLILAHRFTEIKFSFLILSIIILQYLSLIIVSRNYCKQFVLDVLAKK